MLDKKFLNQIIDNLKKESTEGTLTKNSRVLLVDSMNTFIRSFAMVNHLNPNGHHTGGIVGFLMSIGFAIKHIKPTRVICVFDGDGSTLNRKNLYPDYKGNRDGKTMLNGNTFGSYSEMNKLNEQKALENQMERLVQYLHMLPIDMMSIDGIEADDSIGLLAKHISQNEDGDVCIMSADRDFLQLVTDKVTVYSPVKKIFYSPENVKTEFKVSAPNYLYYKVLLGDVSDNLPGVSGLGPKKILKLFPELETNDRISIEDIYEKAKHLKNENILYERVIERKNQLDINLKLMNLHEPVISENNREEIFGIFNSETNDFLKGDFLKMYREDSLGNSIPNVELWLDEVFKNLTAFKNKI